jgi:hypothetical protein
MFVVTVGVEKSILERLQCRLHGDARVI